MATKKTTRRGSIRPGRTSDPRQLPLPGVDDFLRTMPNHLARSSLFSPVARGRKRTLTDHLLVSRSDAEIRFWGEQLDEAQSDVWMHAIFEASKVAPGEAVTIKIGPFLRAIGRSTGKSDYLWLRRTMLKLSFAMIVISELKEGKVMRTLGSEEALHLIEKFKYDAEKEAFTLLVDTRWGLLYAGEKYSRIDWKKRLAFGNQQDMAKSLQRLIATSRDEEQRYGLDWLKERFNFGGRTRNFRKSLLSAFQELERLEIISGGRIDMSTRGTEQATWTRL